MLLSFVRSQISWGQELGKGTARLICLCFTMSMISATVIWASCRSRPSKDWNVSSLLIPQLAPNQNVDWVWGVSPLQPRGTEHRGQRTLAAQLHRAAPPRSWEFHTQTTHSLERDSKLGLLKPLYWGILHYGSPACMIRGRAVRSGKRRALSV